MKYLIVLFAAWLINGSIKFAVNFVLHKKKAVLLIGYGGFPSTHTAIVMALLSYIGFLHGFDNPAVGGLIALLWVVVNDARCLRMRIEEHAKHLNELTQDTKHPRHRDRIGHHLHEILGGVFVGFFVGWFMACVLEYL